MDLFNGKKLSMNEALHYNSILDNGGVDTDILLVHQALKQNDFYNLTQVNPQSSIATVHEQDVNDDIIIADNEPTEIKEKNKARQYIKLPNATITKHKHKYRKRQIKSVDE